MSELFSGESFSVLVRMTFVLAAIVVGIKFARTWRPTLAVIMARALLLAFWVGPILVIAGVTFSIAVLPVIPATLVAEDSVAAEAPVVQNSGAIQKPLNSPEHIVAQPVELLPQNVQEVIVPEFSVEKAPATSWTLWGALAFGWVTITGLLLFRFLFKVYRTWKCIQGSVSCDANLSSVVKRVAHELGIAKPAEVRLSGVVSGPCTAGWLRPVVLLPESWIESLSPNRLGRLQRAEDLEQPNSFRMCSKTLSNQECEMVLAHELTHAEHRDSRWDAFAQWTQVWWWFHPLVALLVRQHRLACEHRCDAAATRIAGDDQTYRQRLAKWALAIRGERQHVLATLAMAERPLLLQRLRWLETGNLEKSLTRWQKWLVAMTVASLCLVVIVAQPINRVNAASKEEKTQGDAEVESVSEKTSKATESIVQKDPGIGYETGNRPDFDWSNMQSLQVLVVDENHQPLKDATVAIRGLTDREGRRGTLAVLKSALEPKTNASGITKIMVPGHARRVRLNVVAKGYANKTKEFSASGKIEFQIEPGRIVTVRAVDEQGKLLPNAFAKVGIGALPRQFKQQENGTLVSPVMSFKRRWMRVVDGSRDDGVVLFSDLIDLKDEKLIDEQGVTNVVLKPGVRLEGKLDDSVPRPVKPGFVELLVAEGEGHRINARGIQWQDQAAVKPDGSFVFTSLPPDAHAQLFVLGEGYQLNEPSRKTLEAYFNEHDAGDKKLIERGFRRNSPMPMLVYLGAPKVQVTLQCRETASLDVRVVDPSGKPIVGADASMSPNLYFFGELIIPGTEWSTRAMIRPGKSLILGGGIGSQLVKDSFLYIKTNEQGIAHFRNIPTLRDSFNIKSPGLVMAAYPTSEPDDPGRYGLARNLRAGELVTMTITMENDVPKAARELALIDADGGPLSGVQVTITDLTTSTEDTDWQQWSVQRFGPVSTGKTDQDGRVLLWYPSQIANQPVEAIRLHFRGRPESNVSIFSDLDVPAKPDGGVIQFTTEKKPRSENSLLVAMPEYIDLRASVRKPADELLAALLAKPSVVMLRQLLSTNNSSAAEPLSLSPKLGRIFGPSPNRRNEPTVIRISTDDGERVVVLATVRPKGAIWVKKPSMSSPPGAAFIFDESGKLITMLGGGSSASGSQENVSLINFGSTGDFFLRVSAFESHPPYKYYSRWYRVGAEGKPSLTVHHYANSISWSGADGKSNPIAEYAHLTYEFNGQDIDWEYPGVNAADAKVPRQILWDGLRNKFYAEPTQQFEGRSLYQVIAEESADFVPIHATKQTVVIAGGRRDYKNWHSWSVAVQDSQEVVARLVLRDSSGKTTRLIHEENLSPGRHRLQLHFGNDKDAAKTKVEVRIDAQDVKPQTKYTIPRLQVDARPSVADQSVYVAAKPPIRLLDKRLSNSKESLVWVIESRE